MNNYCKRQCFWNWKDSCCPETESHYTDGTVYTKNCTQFLRKDYISKFESNLGGCHDVLFTMTYEELKQARYLLTNIKEHNYAGEHKKKIFFEDINQAAVDCEGDCKVCNVRKYCETLRAV
jgi:hypothetical protein